MTNKVENTLKQEKTEKHIWLHSLSRGRKSLMFAKAQLASQKATSNDYAGTTATSSAFPSTIDGSSHSINPVRERKRKDERKNVFQRFKKHMCIQFSIRQKKMDEEEPSEVDNHHDGDSICSTNELLLMPATYLVSSEIIPFTHTYRQLVRKKWLENGSPPNRVMYTACSEMLSQVWYWGEISRQDAQRQLTDKPIGSFLVRDSETGGSSSCWFTLSFRILTCTLHYRLKYRAKYWHFEELQYESIVEMIDDILHRCTKDNFVCYVRVPNELQPPLAVVLKHPVSRYIKIMTLQDMCRRVVLRYVSSDDIHKLPIPMKLQDYFKETQDLVFHSL